MATRPGHETWTRRMTNNAAMAVIVYALLQIVLTSLLGARGLGPIAGLLGIAILMGAVIPFARQLEIRWRAFEASETSGRAVEARFRRDRTHLWAGALLLPFAWIALYLLLRQLLATLGL